MAASVAVRFGGRMNASFANEAKLIALKRTLVLNRVQVSDTFVATKQKRAKACCDYRPFNSANLQNC
jgi:hypothetical protein